MKLINANAIEYSPYDDVYNKEVMIAYKEKIDMMPTVEAIPIDWIVDYIENATDIYRIVVLHMMSVYAKKRKEE